MKKLKKPVAKIKKAKFVILFANDECPILQNYCGSGQYCVKTCYSVPPCNIK